MSEALHIEPRWHVLVFDIFRVHAPRPCRARAFDFLVRGRARRFSDLDLAFDAGRPLTSTDTAILDEPFDESDLPWRADVVDLVSRSPTFRREVESHAMPFLTIGTAAPADR